MYCCLMTGLGLMLLPPGVLAWWLYVRTNARATVTTWVAK